MTLLPEDQWRVAEALSGIGFTNPFSPERMELEKRALGKQFIKSKPYM